jgi:hypothetical protein
MYSSAHHFQPYSISEKHAYVHLRAPPPVYHADDDGTLVLFGWSADTVVFGPGNTLYLHVDVDASAEPLGVEILWADEKLTPGWRESLRADLAGHEVTFGDPARIVSTLCPTYENVRGELGYDGERKLVRMRFERVAPGDPDYDPDRFSDPAFEAFLGAHEEMPDLSMP